MKLSIFHRQILEKLLFGRYWLHNAHVVLENQSRLDLDLREKFRQGKQQKSYSGKSTGAPKKWVVLFLHILIVISITNYKWFLLLIKMIHPWSWLLNNPTYFGRCIGNDGPANCFSNVVVECWSGTRPRSRQYWKTRERVDVPASSCRPILNRTIKCVAEGTWHHEFPR